MRPADQRGQRIKQEQADRLAIPDVDEGHGALQHPLADQPVELLIELDDRIAEGLRTHEQGQQQQQQRQARASRPGGRVRDGGRSCDHPPLMDSATRFLKGDLMTRVRGLFVRSGAFSKIYVIAMPCMRY